MRPPGACILALDRPPRNLLKEDTVPYVYPDKPPNRPDPIIENGHKGTTVVNGEKRQVAIDPQGDALSN
jgi:hypothetical protein